MTTIVPLMHKENPLDVITKTAECVSYLAKNPETHKKIIKSGALYTIKQLISNNLHYETTRNCIAILSNLSNEY